MIRFEQMLVAVQEPGMAAELIADDALVDVVSVKPLCTSLLGYISHLQNDAELGDDEVLALLGETLKAAAL